MNPDFLNDTGCSGWKFPVHWTTERILTKRSVLWVGHACDLKCVFCYDLHMNADKKKWLPFDGPGGSKELVEKFRYQYKDDYIDLMGGEPTIYPYIYKLVEHCASIGLEPTCITHGLHLADFERVIRFKDSGIHDILMSVHGIDETNDRILQTKKPGATRKQRSALENLRKANIAVRFNVTLIDLNKTQLPQIANMAVEYGVPVVNWIVFNPYFQWETETDLEFQAPNSKISPYLKQAIDVCSANNIEANVRYMPICQLKGYEQHIYTGYQLPYDIHEWNYNSWYDFQISEPTAEWYYKASDDQRRRHNYIHADVCKKCAVQAICDGLHKQYASKYGFDELIAYDGEPITNPTYFIRNQLKLQYIR